MTIGVFLLLTAKASRNHATMAWFSYNKNKNSAPYDAEYIVRYLWLSAGQVPKLTFGYLLDILQYAKKRDIYAVFHR